MSQSSTYKMKKQYLPTLDSWCQFHQSIYDVFLSYKCPRTFLGQIFYFIILSSAGKFLLFVLILGRKNRRPTTVFCPKCTSLKVLKNCQHFFCHVKLRGMIAYIHLHLYMHIDGKQARLLKKIRQGCAMSATYFCSSSIKCYPRYNIKQLFCKTGHFFTKT